MSMFDIALGMLQSSPAIRQNPNAQYMMDVIKRGDAQEGERIANNLLNSMGMTREQGLAQASSFFGVRFR